MWRARALAAVGATLLLSLGGTSASATSAHHAARRVPAQASGNLLANPGAEEGEGALDAVASFPPPGWETTSTLTAVVYGTPNSPTLAESARIGGGANYFAGGPDNPLATATQTIDVADRAAAIDAGRLQATLSAWLGGFASQDDNATVTASFRSTAGSELGNRVIGPVSAAERNNETSLRFRSSAALVPSGTRSIQVVLTATRTAGSYNDGYADNINLALGPPPVPVAGVSVNMGPVSGVVLVRLRGTNRFVSLTSLRNVPVGSEFDVTRGRMRLVSAAGGTRTQSGLFYQGRAVVRQPRGRTPVTTLELSGRFACPKRKSAGAAATKPPRSRRLWGNGKGKFRTKGKFAAAAVRGTIWLTEDRCDGTLVRVQAGRVEVTDLVANRRVIVRAGQSYLARARR